MKAISTTPFLPLKQNMFLSRNIFLTFLCFIILAIWSECAEIKSENCKNIAAIKGLIHMVDSVSSSLSDILSNAKFRTKTVEENLCVDSNDDRTRLQTESNDSDHCVRGEQDCKALYELGFKESGPYRIWPAFLNHSIIIYCDMETDGGGWSVIQRRGDFGGDHIDFYRSYIEYQNGFGDIQKEFWLGNDYIFALTNAARNTLRFDLEDFEGERRYAKYRNFVVRSKLDYYKMSIGEYEGNAGDSFRLHDGMEFSAKDRGNHCPKEFKGGWWYNKCHEANLNGQYLMGNHSSFADGINWLHFKGFHYSLAKADMKIKRCDC